MIHWWTLSALPHHLNGWCIGIISGLLQVRDLLCHHLYHHAGFGWWRGKHVSFLSLIHHRILDSVSSIKPNSPMQLTSAILISGVLHSVWGLQEASHCSCTWCVRWGWCWHGELQKGNCEAKKKWDAQFSFWQSYGKLISAKMVGTVHVQSVCYEEPCELLHVWSASESLQAKSIGPWSYKWASFTSPASDSWSRGAEPRSQTKVWLLSTKCGSACLYAHEPLSYVFLRNLFPPTDYCLWHTFLYRGCTIQCQGKLENKVWS